MPCVFVFVPTGNQQFPGQELFQKSSCQSVTCHREQLKESTIPSLICPKKLLSLSCFRNIRKLLFLQMYHALRALILQKKYQKKYEKYTVKFLLLAVALHQLLLYGRCGRCGHSNQTLHMTKTKNANQKPRGEFYVGKIKNQKLSEKKVRIVSSRVNCVFPHVELEAERSELFSRIRRIRCLSFRSCQRLALRELLPKRRLEKFQKTFQKHFVKIFRPSWKQKISKPPPQSQSQEVC